MTHTHESDQQHLTSPGTVRDVELEEQRVREAAERDAESRDSAESRYEQERHEQEEHRREVVARLHDLPAPR